MAQEKTQSEHSAKNVLLDDKNTQTTYANNSHIVVNPSDVYLYFGMQPFTDSEDTFFEQRIVLTHSSFMRMMEYWAPRYTLLARIYNGHPMSLGDFDPSLVQQAFQEMLNPTPETPAPEDKEG